MKNYLCGAIVKIASRCNINCTYCYMYNLADGTFINQPKIMSDENIDLIFFRLDEYFQENRELSNFHFGLHGGEPLLAGKDKIRYFIKQRDILEKKISKNISISIQTNSLLLDAEWVDIFYENDITLGISFDGLKEFHDKHRVDFSNKGTHSKVVEKIKWLRNFERGRSIFNSVLCVIHPEMDGKELINYIHSLDLNGVDLILPDQNYTYFSDKYSIPDGKTYSKILKDAYDEWIRIDDPSFNIRKFEMIIKSFFGVKPSLDSLGHTPIRIFTIETSGEIEPVDTMKCCGEGYTKSKKYLKNTSIIEAHKIETIKIGLNKQNNIPFDCIKCDFLETCGGGYLPHRFKNNNFDNVTVYCNDMKSIISHIKESVTELRT